MVPGDWLRERLSKGAIRALNAGGQDAREAGVSDEAEVWDDLRGAMRPGDEVWRYCSPLPSWEAGRGEMGLAVVRGGGVVAAAVSYRSHSWTEGEDYERADNPGERGA